jgi:molybdopterin/thiamine biosynthesis adenylyltransferase
MSLDKGQITRYSRHILLPEMGRAGQEKLAAASVLVVGVGGLGCPVAQYLAAAGVGKIGLADGDAVDLTNLQRQVLHWDADIGKAKTDSAAEKLEQMNGSLLINKHGQLNPGNIEAVVGAYDLVVEGTDNFPAKFLVNDACVKASIPLVQGGILRFEGQWMAVKPGESACYRCLFSDPPPADSVPNCAEAGVLGAVAGSLGSLMAVEALKILADLGEPLFNRLMIFDAAKARFREVAFRKNPDCKACGTGEALEPLAWSEETGACDPALVLPG